MQLVKPSKDIAATIHAALSEPEVVCTYDILSGLDRDAFVRRMAFAAREQSPDNPLMHWIFWVVLLDDGTSVGVVEAAIHPDAQSEFGYAMFRPFWGAGFATRACRLALDRLAERFAPVTLFASIAVTNLASRKVAERVGFSVRAVLKDADTVGGRPTDEVVYAVELERPATRSSVRPGTVLRLS